MDSFEKEFKNEIFIDQLKTIVFPRIDYWEEKQKGIFNDYFNNSEFVVVFSFLLFATFGKSNQKQIIENYIDGKVLIGSGYIDQGQSLISEAEILMFEFTGTELFHKNIVNAHLDKGQRFVVGDFTFNARKSMLKYLHNKKINVTSSRILKESLENLMLEKKSEFHKEAKNYQAKYYAFFHWLKIELGIHPFFEKDEKDNWRYSKIKAFAEEHYGFPDGQSFYRSFKELHEDWTNKISIARYLGKGYKKIVGEISNQDIKIIEKLKDWPE